MIKELNERGIKASIFFQQRGCTPYSSVSTTILEKALAGNASQQTLGKFNHDTTSCISYAQSDWRLIKAKASNKDFAQELVKEGHSIGLHAVHTKDYKDFSMDLNKISRSFDGKVYGFTKHSSVINYDDSERLSGYINSCFRINDALRGFVYENIFFD